MSDLKRVDNWRQEFEAVADDLMTLPFEWGKQDCGPGFVGRLTQALTRVDLAADYRGQYDSALSALRLMQDSGFANLGDLVASILPEIHISQARIGDIAAIADDTPFGFALGVVNGERIYVRTQSGLGTVDLLDAARAFKVG